jgi:EmrB/QacA subfamily drug resistance transporter
MAIPSAPRTAPAQPKRARGNGYPRRVLLLSSLGVFIVFLDTTVVNIAFETISRSFRTTTADLAWVLNVYSVVIAALLVPAGRFADIYGRKRVFQLGVLGFAATSALCGLAPSVAVLIVARGLQAASAGLVIPTSLALFLPEFTGPRRAAAIGAWGAMGAVSAALGPSVGALLVEYASWRWIFLINLPLCLIVAALGRRLLRETRDGTARGIPDPLGILLVAASPAAFSFAIIEGPGWGWADPRVVVAFAIGVVALPLFRWRSRRAARPIVDLDLFRIRGYQAANVATLVFSMAFFGLMLGNVLFLQTVWHYSVLRSALAMSPNPVIMAVVSTQAGRLSARFGFRPVLVAGSVIFALSPVIFVLTVGGSPEWLGRWLPGIAVSAVGIGLTLPTLSSVAAHALPPSQFAVGSAVNNTFRQLGAVLGVSIFVAAHGVPDAATIVYDFHRVWAILAGIALVTGLVCLGTPGGRLRTTPAN